MKKTIISLLTCCFVLGMPLFASASIDTNLYYGIKNPSQVQELQEFLITKGDLNHASTGSFFSLTLAAVKEYQASVGINATGYVGILTRAAINKELAANLSSSNQQSIAETGDLPVLPITPPQNQPQPRTLIPQNPLPVVNNQAPTTSQSPTPVIVPTQPASPSQSPVIDQNTPIVPPVQQPVAGPISLTYTVNSLSNNIVSGQSNNLYSFSVNNSTGGNLPINNMTFTAIIGSADNFQNMPRIKTDNFGNGMCDLSVNGQVDPYYVTITGGQTTNTYSGNNKVYVNLFNYQVANGQTTNFVLSCQLLNFNVGDSMTTNLSDNGSGQSLSTTVISK